MPFPEVLEKEILLPAARAETKVLQFYTDHDIQPNIGISSGVYTEVDGYRQLNLFVEFTQDTADEAAIDVGLMFAFDASGKMGAGYYVNLNENVPSPQGTHLIAVSGANTWHGIQWKKSSYIARIPVMGPYVQVFVYNFTPVQRKVSVWGYLVV